MIKNNSSNPKTALVDHVMCHSISIVWLSESHKQQRIFRHQNYGNAPRLSNWSFDIVSWPVFIGNSSHLDVYVWRAKFSMNAAFKGSVPIHVPLSKCPDSEPSRHTDSNNVHLKSKKNDENPVLEKVQDADFMEQSASVVCPPLSSVGQHIISCPTDEINSYMT